MKAFVIATDRNYMMQAEVTIKSILLNVPDAKIYVMNEDLPAEWFKLICSFGRQWTDNEIIVDCRVDPEVINQYPTPPNISSIAYARLLAADYVIEKRFVYIDVDAVITTDISDLFTLDLKGRVLAAACDVKPDIGKVDNQFNSGLMVIGRLKWQSEELTKRLFEHIQSQGEAIYFGDQQVLNEVFQGDFEPLDKTDNFMVGLDAFVNYQNIPGYEELKLDFLPRMVHYISSEKPWIMDTSTRLRELWWHYYSLGWEAIIQRWRNDYQYQQAHDQRLKVMTLTNSYALEGIDRLATSLPNCHFIVCAWTNAHPILQQIRQYDNVTLIEKVSRSVIDDLVTQVDVYLDINYGDRDEQVLEKVKARRLPIYGFDDNFSDYQTKTFSKDQLQQMISCLDQLGQEKQNM